MKTIGFDHIQFVVKDLEESINFYTKLGFKLYQRTDHHAGSAELKISPGDIVFEIHSTEQLENPGWDHFAILVDDIDDAVKELREKGIEITDPRYVKVTGRRISDFRDPMGFRWQLVSHEKE